MDKSKSKYLTRPNFNTAFPNLTECAACINSWFKSNPDTKIIIVHEVMDKTYFCVPFAKYLQRGYPPATKNSLIIFSGSLAMLREIALGFPVDLFSSNPAGSKETN